MAAAAIFLRLLLWVLSLFRTYGSCCILRLLSVPEVDMRNACGCGIPWMSCNVNAYTTASQPSDRMAIMYIRIPALRWTMRCKKTSVHEQRCSNGIRSSSRAMKAVIWFKCGTTVRTRYARGKQRLRLGWKSSENGDERSIYRYIDIRDIERKE